MAERTYGGVITARHRLDIRVVTSIDIIRQQLSQRGLQPNVQWTDLGFPLWLPEDVDYFSHDEEAG